MMPNVYVVLWMRSVSIVVSPLIALMKDQVDQLRSLQIPAHRLWCVSPCLRRRHRRRVTPSTRH